MNAALARTHLLENPRVDLHDKTHGRLWIVASEDAYEPSRLLIPGWLASFKDKVDGRPIAIIPERGTLMIGGDGRPEMIRRMLETAEREFDASTRRISPALYTVDDDGKVVPYQTPASNPLANAVALGHQKLATYEYEQQKELLDAHYEKEGIDIFVASYKLFENESGALRSLCVWTKGASRSYLPKTERIVLLELGHDRKAKVTLELPFEALEDRLTVVPGLHPVRYETTGGFPSHDELDTLAESCSR